MLILTLLGFLELYPHVEVRSVGETHLAAMRSWTGHIAQLSWGGVSAVLCSNSIFN